MSAYNNTSLVIKFDQASDQVSGHIRKVSGFVKIKHLLPLISRIGLEANPRDSKVGHVTDAIIDSLNTTPEVFPFKTKGLLIGASSYKTLERNRYQITFVDPDIEGILDGGHNTLAIGLYILSMALTEAKLVQLSKVKLWDDFKTLWEQSQEEISNFRDSLTPEDHELDISVPVELILPLDADDPVIVDEFNKSLFEICTARNNNVQLSAETKANAIGYFEELKSSLPAEIAERVKWRQNEAGDLSPADIVAMVWIALGVLPANFKDAKGKIVEAPNPTQIYASKGECVARFERLMSSDEVTSESGAKRELFNQSVFSAIKVGAAIPALFDRMFEELPALYNANGGNYGRIVPVKKLNQSSAAKYTKFTKKKIATKSPEGFIVPLVYGLRALIRVDDNGIVSWKTDPEKFLTTHLKGIVATYSDVISALEWDPQKVGKSNVSFTTSYNAFETAYLRSMSN